ncbi:hypothetical protein ACTL32_01275 [Planococcus sp. FY231025]|uniref:hypothetical protein n=1 Tax=Planococcus sp. FY231025 TaxID=3455699 RepID=UPI003F914AAF
MRTFLQYLIFNIALILFHVFMYFVSAMGIGGGAGQEPRNEVFISLLIVAAIGASPNLLLLINALLRKVHILENVLWTAVFSIVVMAAYLYLFWPVIQSRPL